MSGADLDEQSVIERAVALLESGRLVAFPTETVYGLGADATNPQAVRRIFAAKGRPGTNPLIVHVSDAIVARRYVSKWPQPATKLTDAFWPGPLTVILPKSETIAPEVSAGIATVGLRAPDHPLALALLRRFDGPIAAPSANRANRISPTTAEHVHQELGGAVDLILDGGPCNVGIESTVLDLCGPVPVVLRPGAITREQIQEVIGPVETPGDTSVSRAEAARSPGMGSIHYSPVAPAFRFEAGQAQQVNAKLGEWPCESVSVLVIKDSPASALIGRVAARNHRIVEMPGDPIEYARRIYSSLREADKPSTKAILVEMPPQNRMWTAICDRVRRATRPI